MWASSIAHTPLCWNFQLSSWLMVLEAENLLNLCRILIIWWWFSLTSWLQEFLYIGDVACSCFEGLDYKRKSSWKKNIDRLTLKAAWVLPDIFWKRRASSYFLLTTFWINFKTNIQNTNLTVCENGKLMAFF